MNNLLRFVTGKEMLANVADPAESEDAFQRLNNLGQTALTRIVGKIDS